MSTDRRSTVALPETRQLDLLANLLERRGIDVVRCPMIAILDSPDREAVVGWIRRFCDGAIDLMIAYTGEGIQRLVSAAASAGLEDSFVARLAEVPILARGPKPTRVLRSLQIRPAWTAVRPTTDGVIETLGTIDVAGRCIGIQLYGAEPLPELTDYLAGRGARIDPVAPYVYASESDDAAVLGLIERLTVGEVDAIAFTSKAQVQRLAAVAQKACGSGKAEALRRVLDPVLVAAIGPVAAAELEALGVRVDVVPEADFFMKPMVTALMRRLDSGPL